MSELYHHGIMGMSWGKRNGPPYPLEGEGKRSFLRQKKKKELFDKKEESNQKDYSKAESEEQISEMKKKAIREGNIKEAAANKDYYSDQELQAVKNRFMLNSEVNRLSKADVKSGQQKANELASKFETAARLTNAVANTASAGIRTYNSLGMIISKVNGTSFEPIGSNIKKSDNKDKKKDK